MNDILNVPLATEPILETLSFPRNDQKHWWNDYVDQIAQPFHPWNGTEWCQMDMSQSLRLQKPAHTIRRVSHPPSSLTNKGIDGFMLSKVHKAASTTAASVTLRIAYRVAHRQVTGKETLSPYVTPMCRSHFYHEFSQANQHSQRDPLHSFLWGTVRLPEARSQSAFYYYIPEQEYTNETKLLQFLERSKGHQLRLLRQRKEHLEFHEGNLFWNPHASRSGTKESGISDWNNLSSGLPENSIIPLDLATLAFEHIQKEVLQFYDFLAVTERWMESMAVLKLLLPHVQYSDVIALRVKERGSYVSNLEHCKYIPFSSTSIPSPRIQAYINGPFQDTNPDYLLYAAVNRSLDLTIEVLGKRRVDEGIRQIQYLQTLAQETCQRETILPCSTTGERQPGATKNCYVRDFGCGHECLDRILEKDSNTTKK